VVRTHFQPSQVRYCFEAAPYLAGLPRPFP